MSHEEASTQFGYEDHFTPARTRKKRKNRPQTAPPSPAALLKRASEELGQGDWLQDVLQALRESLQEAFPVSDSAPNVLCLGLGSPASSRDARAQLAFLLAACDDLSIDRMNVSVYDPVFAEEDLRLLTELGLSPLPEHRQANYELRSPTIAFMPHCDLHLYESLLRENWSSAGLRNILLIANRLSEYTENIPSRKLASEHPCVARLAPDLTSRPLHPCAPFPTAFNNTSIQFLRADALAERVSEWWTLPGGALSAKEGPQGARETATGTAPPPNALSNAATPGNADAQGAKGDGSGNTIPPTTPAAAAAEAPPLVGGRPHELRASSPSRAGSDPSGPGRTSEMENGEHPAAGPGDTDAIGARRSQSQ
ncbi:SRR1-domain-containing protein [Trametes polyzona]|nr:SRR1-domain-containing protein [Trametes polyzona]